MHTPYTFNELLDSLSRIFCKKTEKVFFTFLFTGKNQKYYLPPTSMLILGKWCKEPESNNIETRGIGFFPEFCCVMQKNGAFPKIFCPVLYSN